MKKLAIAIGVFDLLVLIAVIALFVYNSRSSNLLANKSDDVFSEYIGREVVITETPTPTPTATTTPQPTQNPGPTVVPAKEYSRINTTQKIVVFTFDGGAGIQSADKILNILKNHNINSTFFVTGKWIENNTALVQRMSNEGHEVLNHSYDHANFTTISTDAVKQQLSKTEQLIINATGKSSKPYFRFPYGARNPNLLNVIAGEGYQSIFWTVDALDWKESSGITEAEVKNRIMNNVTPGAIYLMHIGDNITGNVLNELFTNIKAQGYQILSLSEAIALSQ